MDYSHLSNDPDHPDGSSPWQSSPAPDRSSFPSEESSPPTPEAPKQTPSTQNPSEQQEQQDQQDDSPSPETSEQEQALSPRPNGSGKRSNRAISQSVPDIRFQGPPMTEEELRQEALRQQRLRERQQQTIHAQQHARGPAPVRYHGKQGQRQPPAYMLQARIISLERIGKKDPAIHFDVHVRLFCLRRLKSADNELRQICPNSAQPKLGTSSARTRSSSN